MMDKMRRNYQRKLNRKIKELNRAIEEDELWKGRFVARQIKAQWEKFSDGSGGVLHVIIRMYDKKTGYYKDYLLDYAPYFRTINWNISMEIANKFIVDDLKIWEYEEPYEIIEDYTNIAVKDNVFKKKFNFYLDRNAFAREEE
jgi:hypothetical protein